MLFSEFVEKYGLEMTAREDKNQDNRFTRSHVKYKIEISADFGKVIVPFQCNPEYHEPELESVLQCVQSDIMMVDPDYSYCADVADFANEFGYTDFRLALDTWNACKAIRTIFFDFLPSQAAIEDFMGCRED